MVHRNHPSDLYLRWFMIVFLPLGLLAIGLVLLPFGILPEGTIWLLVLLGAYAVPAVRLLIERKRSGLGLPLPRKIVVSVAALGAMLVIGIGLFVLGMGRLTTSRGLAMVYIGGCLMILSVTMPTFRLVDIVLRKVAGSFRKAVGGTKQAPGAARAHGSSPRGAPGRASADRLAGTSSRRRKTVTGAGRGRQDRVSQTVSPKRPGEPRRTRTDGYPSRAARLVTGMKRARRPGGARSSQRAQQPPMQALAAPPSPPPEA